jgi:glycosyltransferase involved in cell wall biosynthesis
VHESLISTGVENDISLRTPFSTRIPFEPGTAMNIQPQSGAREECHLSIVVPTFNSEAVLRGCVESFATQTFSDFEIVVVDGASTDRTVALIQELAAKYPNLRWSSEKDGGVYDAMNKGIRLARGKWLLFFGADDRLCADDVLARVAPQLNLDTDFVYGNVVLTNDPFGREGMLYKGEFSVRDIVGQNICHQAIFYSRELFARFGGYNLKYRAFADWDFNLRVFTKVRKKYVPVTVANFQGGGMSAEDNDPEFHTHFVELITRELALDPGSEIYRTQTRGLRRLLRYYFSTGQFKAGFRYLRIWLRHEQFRTKLKRLFSGN